MLPKFALRGVFALGDINQHWVLFGLLGLARERRRGLMTMDSGFFQMLLSDWSGTRLREAFGPE